MKKPVIVTRLKVTQFSAIVTLAESVYESLHLNPNFINPQPTLAALLAAIANLRLALEKWGQKGSRGAHADHVNLKLAAEVLHKMLTQLAGWCMSSLSADLNYAEQTVVLSTSGFPLKRDGAPQGILEMVQNLHLFVARNILRGYIKIRWKKPLNVTSKGNVKSYLVYRSATNDFASASVIASVTTTTFSEAPGIGTWFYWVVAVNHNGNGVVGSSLMAEVFKST